MAKSATRATERAGYPRSSVTEPLPAVSYASRRDLAPRLRRTAEILLAGLIPSRNPPHL